MSETHKQVNPDGTTGSRKTVLWPSSKSLQQPIIRSLFEHNNWKVSDINNQSGSFWKVITSCNNKTLKINLYISSIRDEDRQDDEFKMQLGNTYPEREEEGWITLILGIYTIVEEGGHPQYVLSGYDKSRYDFSTNPSLRGTRTYGLQQAYTLGLYKTETCVIFRPEFIYYYIENLGYLFGNLESHPAGHSSSTVQYTSSLYRPFITAIKSKPFLLLAGISGTGKSRIVRELARACWDEGSEEYEAQKPRNFEMVQVKPNWHDSSELIGYVSRIGIDKDGNPKPVFVAGEFLRFVARAWEEPDVPYFLCLDEMNLAPVEQYFAEYLSVIESRKADSEGKVTTDPILKSNEQWYFDLTATLTEDEETRLRFNEDGICIPQNLIVIGTVNMDETTFSFSRKVLDRAMTIEMNEVDLEGGLENKYEPIGKLGTEELIGTAVEGKDVYTENKDVCDIAIKYLQKINDKLEGTPFKIAYRTRNEVLLYVVNNIPYNQIEGDDDNIYIEPFVVARALDEITNMKILSRIEGDETKVSMKFLETLEEAIHNGLEEAFDSIFEKDNEYTSVSLAKLDEMKKRLSSGYTSFWS